MDGHEETNSHSNYKVYVGKPWTNEEHDAVSCIKYDHVGTVVVNMKKSPAEKKNTLRESGQMS